MWSRMRDAWRYLAALEPARLRAIASSVLLAVVAMGITIPDWLPGRVDAVIVAVWGVISLLSAGEGTRSQVVPVAKLRGQDITQP